MTGYYDHLVEQRDAVLAGARVSARDRARIMGMPLRMPEPRGAATFQKPADGLLRLPAVLRPAGAHQVEVVPDIRATMARARAIVATVAAVWGVEVADILGQRRTVRHARPRHAAMALVARHLRLSLPSIGLIFGRDHSTIRAALRHVAALLAKDACFAGRCREAERRLRGDEA